MSQVALAEELGISRTPLREALRMLQSERLVEAEPNRRVRVAPMSAGDLEELCIARVTLEAEAMRLSVALMTPEDLARLEGYMAEMSHYASAEDYRRWTVPHRSFHRALTAPAGERINDLLGQLFDHAERYRRLHIGHGPSAWASHLARTGFEVAELLEPGYDPAALRAALDDAGGTMPTRRPAKRAKKK
jgi:DNA-binding GntR family transcriptional regulator